MMTTLKVFCSLFFLSVLFGCAGAGDVFYFQELKHPTSMSAYLYGPDKKVVAKGKGLKTIADFKYEKRVWGIMYTFVTLSEDINADLTNKINGAVTNADGDGMINVAITFKESCGISRVPIINLLPFWPGCVDVLVSGEVVKLDGA